MVRFPCPSEMKGFENNGCSGSADAWVQESAEQLRGRLDVFRLGDDAADRNLPVHHRAHRALTAHGRDVSNDGY